MSRPVHWYIHNMHPHFLFSLFFSVNFKQQIADIKCTLNWLYMSLYNVVCFHYENNKIKSFSLLVCLYCTEVYFILLFVQLEVHMVIRKTKCNR